MPAAAGRFFKPPRTLRIAPLGTFSNASYLSRATVPPRVQRGQPRAKMAVLDFGRKVLGPFNSGLSCCSGQLWHCVRLTGQDAPGNFWIGDVLVAGYCATPGGAGAATSQNGSLGFNPRRSHILNKGPCLLQRPGFSSRSGRCAGRPWELFQTRPACRGLLCHPGWSGGSHRPMWQPRILDGKSWGRGCSARRR